MPVVMLTMLFAGMMAATITVKAAVEAKAPGDDTIPNRVYVEDIDIGGMTKEEAEDAVQEYVDQLGDAKLTLAAGKNTFEITAKELGIVWGNPEILEEAVGLGRSGNLVARYKVQKDLEHEDKVYAISYDIDAELVKKALEANVEDLNTEAADAGLKRENNNFVIIPGSQGVEVNLEESVKAVEEYFASWEGEDAKIDIVADVVDPKGTEEELSKVKDVLGTFSTNYGSSDDGRVRNIKRGAELIDGSVVYPGDEFSVYGVTAPHTKANGYELAGAYENGTVVQDYGGGICQVSTTLYNAVIRAELEITERYNHSMIVTYVDPSCDAAIAGDYKDLKFKNNTDAPIYIEAICSGGNIYFTVYGHETRAASREVIFESETISTTEPGNKYVAVDAPIGTLTRASGAHVGKQARLWKIVKENGKEVSREIFNTSTYSPSPATWQVGVTSSYPGASEAVQAAIETQDQATIEATIAGWNDEAMALWTAQQGGAEAPGSVTGNANQVQQPPDNTQQPPDNTQQPDDTQQPPDNTQQPDDSQQQNPENSGQP